MSPFEPYWDPERENWPGLYTIDSKPIKGDVVYDTHIGVWCDWSYIGGSMLACNEYEFRENGEVVRHQLTPVGRDYRMLRTQGRWTLKNDTLELTLEPSEDPDAPRFRRIDLKITDRQGRLTLRTTRFDDDVSEDFHTGFYLPAKAGDGQRAIEAARRKSKPIGALSPPFSTLETLLTMEVPAAIKKLQLTEPVFCIRLFYYDTHAPREGYTISVRVLTEPLRHQVVSRYPNQPSTIGWILWSGQTSAANGEPGRDVGLYEAEINSKSLAKSFGELYDLLCDSPDESMPVLRELCARVCKKLQTHKWGTAITTTDDFIAFPADGSDFFGSSYEDDLADFVPADRVELLRSRGYLE